MKRSDFASNIAQSITGGSWTQQDVAIQLSKRLPASQQKHVAPIAQKLLQELPTLYAPDTKRIVEILSQTKQFDLIYRYCKRKNFWPTPILDPPKMASIPQFADLRTPQIATLAELADFFFMSPEQLQYYADPHSRQETHGDFAVNHYIYRHQKKKNGGYRVIEAPKQILKSAQRAILDQILDHLPAHENAFGFVKGRNCIDAAKRHCAEETVISFDLKDFFPSIGAKRIFGLFRCLGYPTSIAKHLTGFCTTATPSRVLEMVPSPQRQIYRQPHLPQGAPTSPALANHIAFRLDCRLTALARSLNAHYSRYADDMTFSGDRRIAPILQKIVPTIIKDEGFKTNAQKTRTMRQTTRQTVTGIVVNQHLNIDRQTFDHLKAIINACGKPDDTRLQDHRFVTSLFGQISWVETVNYQRGQKLRQLLDQAVAKS